jgi:hypothetical protein
MTLCCCKGICWRNNLAAGVKCRKACDLPTCVPSTKRLPYQDIVDLAQDRMTSATIKEMNEFGPITPSRKSKHAAKERIKCNPETHTYVVESVPTIIPPIEVSTGDTVASLVEKINGHKPLHRPSTRKPYKQEQTNAAIVLFMKGERAGAVVQATGLSMPTVQKIRSQIKDLPACKCGKPGGHLGRCNGIVFDPFQDT